MKLPHVTDHAVLRYLERARGFDVESVRKHIADLCKSSVAIGAQTVHVEGVKFALGTGKVITCEPGPGHASITRKINLIQKVRA